MKLLKRLIPALVLVPALALAVEGGFALERAPGRGNELAALRNGAKLFVNYCLSCHSASSMRYNRLRDIGFSEDQIKNDLLPAGYKIGDLMTVSLSPKDGKEWFGAAPPDLSVIARAKASDAGSGADWIYTYLRSYYKDDSRPTGWNNLVFPNVGMPHALWELQGARRVKLVERKDPHQEGKMVREFAGFEQVSPGKLSSGEYDSAVADLVAYLEWMAEPVRSTRKRLGVWVLLFLAGLAFLAWRLNASFWKEVR